MSMNREGWLREGWFGHAKERQPPRALPTLCTSTFHSIKLSSPSPYQLSLIHICAPNIPSEFFSAMCAVARPLNALIRIRQSACLSNFALLTQGINDGPRWPFLHHFVPTRNVRFVLFILVIASGKNSVQPLQHLATDFAS